MTTSNVAIFKAIPSEGLKPKMLHYQAPLDPLDILRDSNNDEYRKPIAVASINEAVTFLHGDEVAGMLDGRTELEPPSVARYRDNPL